MEIVSVVAEESAGWLERLRKLEKRLSKEQLDAAIELTETWWSPAGRPTIEFPCFATS
jgi:hypothetical protein